MYGDRFVFCSQVVPHFVKMVNLVTICHIFPRFLMYMHIKKSSTKYCGNYNCAVPHTYTKQQSQKLSGKLTKQLYTFYVNSAHVTLLVVESMQNTNTLQSHDAVP
jgi:hypothetical protein